MVTRASYNPIATSSGRGSITKGAIDQATQATATVRQGTEGSLLILDATNLTGKGFQVPATSLTVQTNPNAASNEYFTKQQMQQGYQTAMAMTSFISPAITSLGSLFEGLFDGIGSGGGGSKKSNNEGIAKSEQGGCSKGGCSGGGCNRGQEANNAWEGSCPGGNCQRNS